MLHMTAKQALIILLNVSKVSRDTLDFPDTTAKKLNKAIYLVEKHIKHEVK